MPGAQRSKNTVHSQLPPWEYLGGESLTMDGAPQALTLPSETSIFVVNAETAAIYYAINGPLAGPASPGYCPTDQGRIEGPLSNLASCTVWGAAADTGVAHVSYYREV